MADATTVVEGKIKYREGRKWKPRWCVLKKSSPVADRLQLILYKDVHEALRVGGKVKTSFPLDGYCGLESGFVVERENNVLAILCQRHITLLAFDNREYLIQFEIKIRRSLGQDYQYPVQLVKVPAGSRLPLEGVKLLVHGTQFCMTAHIPPRILQSWNVADLRRYGSVDGKFCFEGGSRCGKGVGVHAVQTDQADEIAEVLRVNCMGKASAASRAGSYRSSQLLEYSLANADSSAPQDDNPGRWGSESGASAVGDSGGPNLMCCQGLPAGGQGDEWGYPKRHSVGFPQHHCSLTVNFSGKPQQTAMKDPEHQQGMTQFDIPTKYSHKLDTVSCSNRPVSGSFPANMVEDVSAAGSATSSDVSCVGAMSSRLSRLIPGTELLDPEGRNPMTESGHSLAASQSRLTGRGYSGARSLDTSVFDSMVDAQVDTTKRMEALQTLRKQETDLQQEMVLLEQMLQSCHSGNDGDFQFDAGNEATTVHMGFHPEKDELSLKQAIAPHITLKASSVPPLVTNGMKDPEVNMPAVQKLAHFPVPPDHGLFRQGRMSVHNPLTPPIVSQMDKLPVHSHLNAPLPYVNLTKYDRDKDSGFLYIHGAGRNSNSKCVTVPPKLHRNAAGGSLASLGNIVGMIPVRSWSETRMLPEASLDNQRNIAPQKPLPVPPKEDSDGESGCLDSDLAISTERLDDDVLLPPTTYAPPVPYPRQLTTTTSSTAAVSQPPHVSNKAMHLPPPLHYSNNHHHLYINESPPLPPRIRQETPPPELPPKGPALLRRSKLFSSGSGIPVSNTVSPETPVSKTVSPATLVSNTVSLETSAVSNTVPPALPVKTRSLSVGSEGTFSDYDNQPPLNRPPMPLPEPAKMGRVEDTYLPMGSPKSTALKAHNQKRREGEYSRPSSLYVPGSPRLRNKGLSSAGQRGNADVLSGYMDMANMFVDEPKPDFKSSSQQKLRSETLYTGEQPILQPTDALLPPESNYMEMASLPPPSKRKSCVLKNLEALHTYVSATTSGEAQPRVRSRSSTPNPPSPSNKSSTATSATPSATSKSSCKIYTRISSCNRRYSEKAGSPGKSEKMDNNENPDNLRPAIPFTNLKNFEQKHSKPSYVNTYIPAPDVPLPEPPKKEEGFFARLIRRNSKDKNASQSQDNLNVQKNRTSVFERTMSVHIQGQSGEEKSSSKLKIGRRRSASFPNRLSFQETTGNTASSESNTKDTAPTAAPSIKHSSSVKSSSSSKSPVSLGKSIFKPATPSSQASLSKSQQSSSSVQDLSDDSDMVPLLQHGRSSCSQSDMTVLTVLHVQPDPIVNPVANLYADLNLCSSGGLLSPNFADASCRHSSCSTLESTKTLTDSSETLLSSSSKTDDEKLVELFETSKRRSVVSEAKSKMSLSLEPQFQEKGWMVVEDSDTAPQLPPRRKQLAQPQPQPLTPLSEVSSRASLSLSTPSPPTPSHHLVPSAPNQDEAIYVDMKELRVQLARSGMSSCTALPPSSSCQEMGRTKDSKERTGVVEDEESGISDPHEVRLPPSATLEPPPPLPGLSPRLPADFTSRFSHRHGSLTHSAVCELHCSSPLAVSVETLDEAGDDVSDRLSLFSQGSYQTSTADDSVIHSSLALTVLRPRWGKDYQVVERRRAGQTTSACSTPASHSPTPTYLNVFTYEVSSLTRRKSPGSESEQKSSPGCAGSTRSSVSLIVSKERTPPPSVSEPLCVSKEFPDSPELCASRQLPLPLPPRSNRKCHRALSESSGQTESPRLVSHRRKPSLPTTTQQVPNSSVSLAPEILEPMLNYAEIDLSAPVASPSPVKITRQFSWRQKKPPPKLVPIEYTQIDHTATSALKRAGQEHAQSREDYGSLRRGATILSLSRKNSAPVLKERKGSSGFFRDRKLSTCSMESI